MDNPARVERAVERRAIMKLQGRIPVSARETALELQSNIRWQKYVVYDVIISLAITYQDADLNGLEFHPQIHDNYDITANFFNSPEVKKFCVKRRANNNASFFRHAMFHGANVIKHFLEKKLPDDIDPIKLHENIKNKVGGNERYKDGLDWLEEFASSSSSPA